MPDRVFRILKIVPGIGIRNFLISRSMNMQKKFRQNTATEPLEEVETLELNETMIRITTEGREIAKRIKDVLRVTNGLKERLRKRGQGGQMAV